jgi:hypothetical protein
VWTPERINAWRIARHAYITAMRERKKVLVDTSSHADKLGTGVTAYNAYVATQGPSPARALARHGQALFEATSRSGSAW